jgi:hypothetical protein
MPKLGAILLIAAVVLATIFALNKFGPGVSTLGAKA